MNLDNSLCICIYICELYYLTISNIQLCLNGYFYVGIYCELKYNIYLIKNNQKNILNNYTCVLCNKNYVE